MKEFSVKELYKKLLNKNIKLKNLKIPLTEKEYREIRNQIRFLYSIYSNGDIRNIEDIKKEYLNELKIIRVFKNKSIFLSDIEIGLTPVLVEYRNRKYVIAIGIYGYRINKIFHNLEYINKLSFEKSIESLDNYKRFSRLYGTVITSMYIFDKLKNDLLFRIYFMTAITVLARDIKTNTKVNFIKDKNKFEIPLITDVKTIENNIEELFLLSDIYDEIEKEYNISLFDIKDIFDIENKDSYDISSIDIIPDLDILLNSYNLFFYTNSFLLNKNDYENVLIDLKDLLEYFDRIKDMYL